MYEKTLGTKLNIERKPKGLIKSTTDISLFLGHDPDASRKMQSKEHIKEFLLEKQLPDKVASLCSEFVIQTVTDSKISKISPELVISLVNAKLDELKLEEYKIKEHIRFGLTKTEVEQTLIEPDQNNANTIYGPEAMHKVFGDAVAKSYALNYLFPEKYNSASLSLAHIRGDIHIHDLDYFITRPYCMGHDLRYLARYGLVMDGTGRSAAVAKPARAPEVLLLHAAKWLGVNQAYFSGAQAYSTFNTVVAPYLKGLKYEQIKQLAQLFIFEMGQMSVARGAQVVFSDLNIDLDIPKPLKEATAIGPKGKAVGTYADYQDEALEFAKAMLDVYMDGDGRGVPFMFPKPLIKIRRSDLGNSDSEDVLYLAAKVSAKMGSPYFINQVSYDDETVSMCCRLRYKLNEDDLKDMIEGKIRSNALQNVSINLPRLAYEAKGNDKLLFDLLKYRMHMAKEVHKIKRHVIMKEMDAGMYPLFSMNLDGETYFRPKKSRHLIGMVGLNEMVKYHTGKEMHENQESFRFGWKVIKFMNDMLDEFSEDVGAPFALEQTPAESTAYRFAKLDVYHFPEQAKHNVLGDVEKNEIYYTNSTHFRWGIDMPLAKKIKSEGLFNPLIEAGCLSHIFLGEASPDAESILNFTKKTMTKTMNQQIAYTRDITYCSTCGKVMPGIQARCKYCNSEHTDSWSRITGYLQSIKGWNKGKLAELRDRYHYSTIDKMKTEGS